jgi:carbonic anhydrase
VRTIRANRLMPKDLDVSAWIYDVHTGRLNEVPVPD